MQCLWRPYIFVVDDDAHTQSHQTNYTEFPRTHTHTRTPFTLVGGYLFVCWVVFVFERFSVVTFIFKEWFRWNEKLRRTSRNWSVAAKIFMCCFWCSRKRVFIHFYFVFFYRDNVAHCFHFVFFSSVLLYFAVLSREKKNIQRWQRTMRQTDTHRDSECVRKDGRLNYGIPLVKYACLRMLCAVSLLCAFMPPKTNNGKIVILWHFGFLLSFAFSSPFGRLRHLFHVVRVSFMRNAGHNIIFGYLYCLYLYLVRSIVCFLPLCDFLYPKTLA